MSPFDCGSQAQVEHRLGCRLGKAEPVTGPKGEPAGRRETINADRAAQ
jgi:hypothetical protein